MIRCHQLSFAYTKGVRVLNGFTHEFRPGITMLKGPSGCGKTTLLRLMGGHLPVQSGSVSIDGYQGPQDLAFSRKGSAFMFQQMNLLPLGTVWHNLELVCDIAEIPRKESKSRSDEILARLGLTDYANRTKDHLSGGQQQRAALARALVKRPRYLFLDEPTANLDKLNTAVIRRCLTELPSDTVCIISSHDERLEGICNEILDFSRFLPLERHLLALA